MAVKGSVAKAEITQKILETFSGAFMANEKEIRIPWVENGVDLQIKVALTCAKDMICGEPVAEIASAEPAHSELTEEEKAGVRNLIKELNL